MTNSNRPTLWYRQHPYNGDLVFAEPGDALYSDALHRALGSETWGEFRRLMPEAEFHDLIYGRYEHLWDLEVVPEDDEIFDCTIFPAVAQGDYPEWLQQRMQNLIPKDIAEKYGRSKATVFNGDYLSIDPEHENEIVDALRNKGFAVKQRSDLRFW